MNNITFGDDAFGHYETVAGGAGAVRRAIIYCKSGYCSERQNEPFKKKRMGYLSVVRYLKF